MMSRAGLFRVSEGVAVDMKERVFRLPSFYGINFSPFPVLWKSFTGYYVYIFLWKTFCHPT